MSKIKLGCHVGMAGKEMFLASAKEAASYGANVFMLYTGAPQNTRRKEISELNIEAGWKYAKEHGIEEIIDELPSEQTMFRLLEKAGCAKTVYDIGLDESAVLPSLRLAPYTRRRLSLLRISKMLDIRGE